MRPSLVLACTYGTWWFYVSQGKWWSFKQTEFLKLVLNAKNITSIYCNKWIQWTCHQPSWEAKYYWPYYFLSHILVLVQTSLLLNFHSNNYQILDRARVYQAQAQFICSVQMLEGKLENTCITILLLKRTLCLTCQLPCWESLILTQ